MSEEDEGLIVESAETLEEAYAAAKNRAAEAWGHGNFDMTASPNPSKNLTTGETLLYTAYAKRTVKNDDGGSQRA